LHHETEPAVCESVHDFFLPSRALFFINTPQNRHFSDNPAICHDISGGSPAHHPERVVITVDGSGDGHSVALFPDDEVYFMYEKGASNNDAEFNAVILALQNLPRHAAARVRTDSQAVVWHLTTGNRTRNPSFIRKGAEIQELILEKGLHVEIEWIPRQQNPADRLLRRYIASLCGAGGKEPLYTRVKRLESENQRLRAKLRQTMRLLRSQGALPSGMTISPDLVSP
jgi:ribonuclease HI